MLQKLFTWLLFLGLLFINLILAWWFWLAYSLLTPHSNIVYTGWTYWSWKFLLIQSVIGALTFCIHLFMGGRALLSGNYARARGIALVVVLILIIQYLIAKVG